MACPSFVLKYSAERPLFFGVVRGRPNTWHVVAALWSVCSHVVAAPLTAR